MRVQRVQRFVHKPGDFGVNDCAGFGFDVAQRAALLAVPVQAGQNQRFGLSQLIAGRSGGGGVLWRFALKVIVQRAEDCRGRVRQGRAGARAFPLNKVILERVHDAGAALAA